MLAETLVVTAFVAGVLIFLFIQFSNLSNSYNEYYVQNSSQDLYSLAVIKFYLENDSAALNYLDSNLSNDRYVDISNCSIFSNVNYCKKLLELERISSIIVTTNPPVVDEIDIRDEDMISFMSKISNEGNEKYRLIAKFNGGSLATVRVNGN